MGKNAELKQIRGQLRQLVKELLPEVLTEQLVEAIQKKLSGQLYEGLNKIDDRQKDLQAYLVRNTVVQAPIVDNKPQQS